MSLSLQSSDDAEDPRKGEPLLAYHPPQSSGSQDLAAHNPRVVLSPRAEPRAHLPPAQGRLCGCACSPLVSYRVRAGLLAFIIVATAIGLTLLFVLPKRTAPHPARTTRVAVNTWWGGSANASYQMLRANYSALDAVIAACVAAEESFAWGDHTVGPDGSPDTTGETTLDALLCDGATGDVAAVADLRRIPSAIKAARAVMAFTTHTLLAGEAASNFTATYGGQTLRDLTGNFSRASDAKWRNESCQPNYYAHLPGADASCGPYAPQPLPVPSPLPLALHAGDGTEAPAARAARMAALRASRTAPHRWRAWAREGDHDTLGACALDAAGSLSAGLTSNGANHKVAGRVGDGPVIGAGAYASDDAKGCAAATGDGDITQRFLPAFVAVEEMRRGATPAAACETAVRRIMHALPGSDFSIGLVCLSADGSHAAAAHGWGTLMFKYWAASDDTQGPVLTVVPPLQ